MPRTLVRELEIAVTASRSADFMVGTDQWFGADAVSVYSISRYPMKRMRNCTVDAKIIFSLLKVSRTVEE
jgi:hypothetical protein